MATKETSASYTKSTVSIRDLDCALHRWNVKDGSKTSPKALVIVYHGFLAHGLYPTVRYAAECIAGQSEDYAVVAADLPGHGASPGLKGYLPSAKNVIEDGKTVARHALGLFDSKSQPKLFLVGSSLGGAIAISVARELDEEDKVPIAGVVLLAPMLGLKVSSVERHALKALNFLALSKTSLIPSSSTSSAKQYRDEKKRKECDEDPLAGTGGGSTIRVGSALSCVDVAFNVKTHFASISVPYLLMIANEDVVVDNAGSEAFHERSTSPDKTVKRYAALHGLLCEPEPLFSKITTDMIDWIKARV